jgi:hypothetical protein
LINLPGVIVAAEETEAESVKSSEDEEEEECPPEDSRLSFPRGKTLDLN